MTAAALSISGIAALYAAKGGRMYSGEPVTQLEHALRTALPGGRFPMTCSRRS